jgi:hypothetical protein
LKKKSAYEIIFLNYFYPINLEMSADTHLGENFRTNNTDDNDYLAGLAAANAERKSKKEGIYLSDKNIIVYPNPTDKEINIAYNNIELNSKIIILQLSWH